jgi:hypothetical protein
MLTPRRGPQSRRYSSFKLEYFGKFKAFSPFNPFLDPKTLHRKTVEENMDDGILTLQYFQRTHKEERRELKLV